MHASSHILKSLLHFLALLWYSHADRYTIFTEDMQSHYNAGGNLLGSPGVDDEDGGTRGADTELLADDLEAFNIPVALDPSEVLAILSVNAFACVPNDVLAILP